MLDGSVLVGIIRGAPDARGLLDVLESDECAVGAPTLVEARLWCSVNLTTRLSEWLEQFIETGPGTVVPFSPEMADVASQAFRTFGRGSGHSAQLDFGDCLAYAVSVVMRAPLLFKGGDFGLTDVMAHPAAIRM